MMFFVLKVNTKNNHETVIINQENILETMYTMHTSGRKCIQHSHTKRLQKTKQEVYKITIQTAKHIVKITEFFFSFFYVYVSC